MVDIIKLKEKVYIFLIILYICIKLKATDTLLTIWGKRESALFFILKNIGEISRNMLKCIKIECRRIFDYEQ